MHGNRQRGVSTPEVIGRAAIEGYLERVLRPVLYMTTRFVHDIPELRWECTIRRSRPYLRIAQKKRMTRATELTGTIPPLREE